MAPLTEEEINSFMEKIGEIFDVPLFTEMDTNRLLTVANASVQWEETIKEELTKAGLTHFLTQIPLLPCNPATNNSILSLQALAPLFALYNLDVSKANLSTLSDKITASASIKPSPVNGCLNYTTPFPRDCYVLDEVKTLRPEYLAGTWFNRQNRPFKVDIELDWVNQMYGDKCHLGNGPMWIGLYASTGDEIWDFIAEVHIHRTAMMEFTRPRDGWIESSGYCAWKNLPVESPLNFIERMTKVVDGRTLVNLNNGTGGWAKFEGASNSEVTAAAARLLFSFSDPLYCARSDGKVVIKLKDTCGRATLIDMTKFPAGRTLVNGKTKFPSCIP